jgi:hypothetical protein
MDSRTRLHIREVPGSYWVISARSGELDAAFAMLRNLVCSTFAARPEEFTTKPAFSNANLTHES